MPQVCEHGCRLGEQFLIPFLNVLCFFFQNWVKYGLPVNQGDSVVSDDKCLTESKLKKDGDACAGYCMTINITRTDQEHSGKTVGECFNISIQRSNYFSSYCS